MRTTGATDRPTTPPARNSSKPLVTASSVSGIETSRALTSKHSYGGHSRGLRSFPLSPRERGTGVRTTDRGASGVIPELSPLLGALFLLGNYLVSESQAFALDVALILSGIPAY